MHFNSVLISCFFFAFAALAAETSTVYAGAVWQNQTEGTFDYVHGIFTVPGASTPEATESFATVEVIFDNGSCSSGAMFRLGVNLDVKQNGWYSYRQALYQWHPDPVQKLNISISTEDTIQLQFTLHSTTSGEVFVKNLDNDQTINMTVSSEHPLCGRAAGWVVQDENNDSGQQTALANFGMVYFEQARAGIEGGFYWGPLWATLVQFSGLRRAGDDRHHIMGSVVSYDDGSATITFATNGAQA